MSDLRYTPFGEKKISEPTTADVVQWMCKFVVSGKQDRGMRALAEQITSKVQSGDYASEALAIYHWVCCHVRYLRDPHNVERVVWPQETLKIGAGDCDDISVLLACLMESIGAECSFGLAAFTPDRVPSHVFCIVHAGPERLVLDPVANRETKKMLGEITALAIVSCDRGVTDESMLSQSFNGWGGWLRGDAR